jgi:hypothetical protein
MNGALTTFEDLNPSVQLQGFPPANCWRNSRVSDASLGGFPCPEHFEAITPSDLFTVDEASMNNVMNSSWDVSSHQAYESLQGNETFHKQGPHGSGSFYGGGPHFDNEINIWAHENIHESWHPYSDILGAADEDVSVSSESYVSSAHDSSRCWEQSDIQDLNLSMQACQVICQEDAVRAQDASARSKNSSETPRCIVLKVKPRVRRYSPASRLENTCKEFKLESGQRIAVESTHARTPDDAEYG